MFEAAAGVMRMSADDDDQVYQQHEVADPGKVVHVRCSKRHDRSFVVHTASEFLSEQNCFSASVSLLQSLEKQETLFGKIATEI